MIKFRDTFSDTSKFISEPGSMYLDEYEYETDKNGVESLVKTDRKTNVYEKIQADYPSTDINLLMKRFALGETSAINVFEGFYADVSKMPKTYAELFDRVGDCREYFDSLPADLKEMFGNSYSQFFSEFNSDEKGFMSKIDDYNDRFVDHSFEVPVDDLKVGDDDE